MKKLFRFILIFVSLLTISLVASAEIYKKIDPDGHVTYSNVKIKGAKKLDIEPSDTSFGTNPTETTKRANPIRTPTPNGFPKVDANTQKQRDDSRKEILKSELNSEKAALENAKKAYSEGQSNPEVYKTTDGKTLRNVAKFQEKMKTLQADVDAHQRNIDLLEKEIINIQ
jgi:hypothetical protein